MTFRHLHQRLSASPPQLTLFGEGVTCHSCQRAQPPCCLHFNCPRKPHVDRPNQQQAHARPHARHTEKRVHTICLLSFVGGGQFLCACVYLRVMTSALAEPSCVVLAVVNLITVNPGAGFCALFVCLLRPFEKCNSKKSLSLCAAPQRPGGHTHTGSLGPIVCTTSLGFIT